MRLRRLRCTRACDRAHQRCSRRHHVCAWVRPPGYISQRTRQYIYMYISMQSSHACIYIHARLATPMNGSPMRARRTHAPTCCVRARAHVCACAIGRPRIRADTCERHPSASTACGSAHRRSIGRRRSTQTSARGTPPQCRISTRYAPPFSGPAARDCGGTRSAGRRCSAGRCAQRHRRCAHARVCANVWACACAGAHVCRYSCCAQE